MATYTFRLPDIGEGIAEAEIVAWHVAVGDLIEEDGRIADMMTDKATVEMESPVSGRVVSIAGEVGDVVAIGSTLVTIEIENEAGQNDEEHERLPSADNFAERIDAETPFEESAAALPTLSSTGDEGDAANVAAGSRLAAAEVQQQPAATVPASGTGSARALASPAVRQRARDLGIDLAQVRPSDEGRVRHADLDQFLAYNGQGGYRPAASVRDDERIKVIGMRRSHCGKYGSFKAQYPSLLLH